MSPRYALYLAPDEKSAWGAFGAEWLGRCAITGERKPRVPIEGVAAERLARLIAQPARYGFHATLKAPFRLKPDAVAGTLIAKLDQFCSEHSVFALPGLAPARLGDFIALVPAGTDTRADNVAAGCVTHFDALRAPLGADDLARRRRPGLTPRDEEHLARWGYPYVLDRFRLHFSLTGNLKAEDAPLAEPILRAAAQRIPAEPLVFDSIRIFREACQGADFECIHRAAFARTGSATSPGSGSARGRLIYVIGPSGAGKDSVIDWARAHLPAGAPVEFARRTITRARDAGGERHLAMAAEAFDTLCRQGQFVLHWEANGQRYGIGQEVRAWLARGLTVVVGGSREYLPRALEAFPGLEVVHVCASPETRRERLAARGRESDAAIAERLARRPFRAPTGIPWIEIRNEGDLESAGRAFQSVLLGRAAGFGEAGA